MPKSLARVALFWIAYIAILVGTGMLKAMAPGKAGPLVWGVAASALLLALTVILGRAHDAPRPPRVGRGSLVRFAIGAAIGVAVVAVNLVVVRLFVGPITIVANLAGPLPAGAWLAAFTFLALSCMEELGFRGYALRELIASTGVIRAQVIVAVAFGLSHVLYGWSITAIAMGVIPTGVLFGVVAVASGGLAMPIGLHAALNMALWALSAKEDPGIWTVVVPPASQATMGATSPWIGTAAVLLWAFLIWIGWGRRRVP